MYIDSTSFSSFAGFILVELSLHLAVLAVYPIFKVLRRGRQPGGCGFGHYTMGCIH